MRHRLCLALLLLAVPGLLHAQEAPERLLPSSTQLYFRFDGIAPHRAGFDQTAVGKMLQGDSGKFLSTVWTTLVDNLGDALTVPQLLGGAKPEMLKQLQTDAIEAPKLLQTIEKHGLIVAVEVRGFLPPQYQVVLIVPNAGEQPAAFLGAIRLLVSQSQKDLKEEMIDGLKVWHLVDDEETHVAWWIDGKDGIAVASSDKLDLIVKRSRDKANRLADSAQFKKVTAFKQFPTMARGYFDSSALIALAGQIPPAAQVVKELGLDNLKSARFWSGYEGVAARSLFEIDLAPPRQGLLKMVQQKPLSLGDLPSLPSDMTSVTAVRIDPSAIFDGVILAMRTSLLFDADGLKDFEESLRQADQLLGLKLRDDFLAQLGDLLVVYSSPAEGPFGLGHTFCFRVKDEKKVQLALEKLMKVLADNSPLVIKKRSYRGVDVHEAHFKAAGNFFLPTWTFHDGWLAISYYPQPIQGFILRSKGELPGWKPDESTQAALAKLPKEYTFLSISDPRASLKSVLSLAPAFVQFMRAFSSEFNFDVSSIPNAHEATKHLFPNVTVATDDGTALRFESRSSLQLPFDFTGLDAYSFFLLFALADIF